MTGFEENEVSLKAHGGTEITKRSISFLIPDKLQQEFQIIPSRLRQIEQDKIRIYWVHDLPQDPEVNHLKNKSSRDKFHKIIFNGNWHLNECVNHLQIPRDDKIDIIETAVDPIPYVEKPKNEINLIYFSTPQRGLELLVAVFDE